MSDPSREDFERDEVLDAAWRAHSNELPPQRLDAAVLAAAHREVHAQPTPLGGPAVAQARKPARAWWGLAAAATIGAIAFGVLQQQPNETPSTPATASDVPPPREQQQELAKVPAQPPPASAPAAAAPPPPRVTESSQLKRRDAETEAAAPVAPPPQVFVPPPEIRLPKPADSPRIAAMSPPPPAAEPAPAAPEARVFPGSPAREEKAEAPRQRERESRAGFASTPRPPAEVAAGGARANADAASRPSAPLGMQAGVSPDTWIVRIEELMRAGRRDEAARELRAFRGAYADADARLPASLREWAATVPRE